MLSKITKIFYIVSTPLSVYPFPLCNEPNNFFLISTKTSDKNIPNIYRIFHIHQIKNLYTKLFENTPNLSNLV